MQTLSMKLYIIEARNAMIFCTLYAFFIKTSQFIKKPSLDYSKKGLFYSSNKLSISSFKEIKLSSSTTCTLGFSMSSHVYFMS